MDLKNNNNYNNSENKHSLLLYQPRGMSPIRSRTSFNGLEELSGEPRSRAGAPCLAFYMHTVMNRWNTNATCPLTTLSHSSSEQDLGGLTAQQPGDTPGRAIKLVSAARHVPPP